MNTWIYKIKGYNPDKSYALESVFYQANGCIGIRGYAEEGIPGKTSIPENFDACDKSMPHQYSAGFFDDSPITGDTMVNLPTLKLIYIFLDGEKLDLSKGKVSNFVQSINFKSALFNRSFVWTSPKGNKTKLSFNSFLSYEQKSLYLTKILITPLNWNGKIILEDVFDSTGKTLRHHHYKVSDFGEIDKKSFCEIKTNSSNMTAFLCRAYLSSDFKLEKTAKINNSILTKLSATAVKSQELSVTRFLSVVTSFNSPESNLREKTHSQLKTAIERGWDSLLIEQQKCWEKLWEIPNIDIQGDPDSELKLRFYIFQMLQSYRPGNSKLSIGSKFLSGDHYSGHYFWDTEIYVFPFYLFTVPDAARNLIDFRINNLNGAKLKSKNLGFKGAFFPWEASPLDGKENCPEWWQDEDADKPTYIPCGKIQIHISADILIAINKYLSVTGMQISDVPGLPETVAEIARFFVSRGTFESNVFSFKNVIGADEYHEYVDNNAYTNHTAKFVIDFALELNDNQQKSLFTSEEICQFKKISHSIQLGMQNDKSIIAQDDSYLSLPEFDLSNFNPEKPLYRQISIEEMGKFQITKQADVIALFFLFPKNYSKDLIKKCWDYYEPRTIHDSNLSAGPHSIVANMLDLSEKAWLYFLKTINLDANLEASNLSEGLHAANAGNAWNTVMFGFAGISCDENGLYCSPKLPSHWEKLSFTIFYKSRKINWIISKNETKIFFDKGEKVNIIFKNKKITLTEEKGSLQLVGKQ